MAPKDFMQDWDNYQTAAVLQFDLIMADISDLLNNNPVNEVKQYVRGLRDGNRFSQKRPEMKPLMTKNQEKQDG